MITVFNIMCSLDGDGSTLPDFVIPNFKDYVPWDISLFYSAIATLKDNMGAGINIGIWIFFIVSGIYLAVNLVDSIGR